MELRNPFWRSRAEGPTFKGLKKGRQGHVYKGTQADYEVTSVEVDSPGGFSAGRFTVAILTRGPLKEQVVQAAPDEAIELSDGLEVGLD